VEPLKNNQGINDMTCIFCRILAGEVPGTILYRDDRVTAFQDARPIAPVHVLVVPNLHITSLENAASVDEGLLGHMLLVGRQMATQEGIGISGYRLVINTGPDAGQSVFHLHLHVIGGRPLPFRFE
jgi:histidine triad (HIT) family protein